jgi:hypothetical protein
VRLEVGSIDVVDLQLTAEASDTKVSPNTTLTPIEQQDLRFARDR